MCGARVREARAPPEQSGDGTPGTHAGASGKQGPAPGWLALRQLVRQPVQPIVQARALCGTGGLHVPLWEEEKVSSGGKGARGGLLARRRQGVEPGCRRVLTVRLRRC